MSLVSLILDSIPCPFNNAIQDSDAVIGPTSWPESAAKFDFKLGSDLLTEPIELINIPKDCEVISVHHYPDVFLLVPKYARGGFATSEPNFLKECNVGIFPILGSIAGTIEGFHQFTTHSWLIILRGDLTNTSLRARA